MRRISWTLCLPIWAASLGMAQNALLDPALRQNAPVDPVVMQPYEAHATVVSGKVDRVGDELPWAVSNGEHVPIQQTITTGPDGYARFEVKGGSSFDLLSNSKVVFRQNAASAGDLLDVKAGRVRVHLQPGPGQWQQRIFCPVAIVSTHEPATVSLAVDEDSSVRIDVLQGEVRVQHALLPRSDPVLVKAVDAILVRPDEQISRKVDRGSLYRYTVKILVALTPGHKNNEPIEGKPLLAKAETHIWQRLAW
ncbi:MAG TPA: FecR domain-containing protein [Bryobacteraceae bacterium]|nr:FecR domain-containing protein [Bryobacteraceae bacterium]